MLNCFIRWSLWYRSICHNTSLLSMYCIESRATTNQILFLSPMPSPLVHLQHQVRNCSFHQSIAIWPVASNPLTRSTLWDLDVCKWQQWYFTHNTNNIIRAQVERLTKSSARLLFGSFIKTDASRVMIAIWPELRRRCSGRDLYAASPLLLFMCGVSPQPSAACDSSPRFMTNGGRWAG